ncbi:MAG: NUDIX domain-containing protein [Mariniblastus sp.]
MSDSPKRAAVAVIVDGNRFLTILRSQSVRAPGQICFPGGGIETAESPQAATVREMREELGVRVNAQREIWKSVSPRGLEIHWWKTVLEKGQTITPNPDEVDSFSWLSAKEIVACSNLLDSNRRFFEALENGEFSI